MVTSYKKEIKRKIEKYCDTHYTRINKNEMDLGEGLFNHRCQYNAIQQVKQGSMKSVFSCIIYNDDYFPVVHFINKDWEGKFIDNTLGWKYELYDYYIVSEIDTSQFKTIDNVLINIKETLLDNCSSRLKNWIYRINYENLGI